MTHQYPPPGRWPSRLRNIVQALSRIERFTATFMFCVVIVTMGAQVFVRYVLHRPFSWSEELSRFALVWMSFVAAAFIMADGKHIQVDLWTQRVSTRSSRRLDCVSHLVVALACFTLFLGGLKFVWYVRPVGSPTTGISKGLWYAAVEAGLLLMGVHAVANLFLQWLTGEDVRSLPSNASVEQPVTTHGDSRSDEFSGESP